MPINVIGNSSHSHDSGNKNETSLFVKKTLSENKLYRKQHRRRH